MSHEIHLNCPATLKVDVRFWNSQSLFLFFFLLMLYVFLSTYPNYLVYLPWKRKKSKANNCESHMNLHSDGFNMITDIRIFSWFICESFYDPRIWQGDFWWWTWATKSFRLFYIIYREGGSTPSDPPPRRSSRTHPPPFTDLLNKNLCQGGWVGAGWIP